MIAFSYHGNTVYYIHVRETKKGQKKQEDASTKTQGDRISYHNMSRLKFYKKSSSCKNHISFVKYFTPQDTKTISLQKQ